MYSSDVKNIMIIMCIVILLYNYETVVMPTGDKALNLAGVGVGGWQSGTNAEICEFSTS